MILPNSIEARKFVRFVVDDSGNGRPLGADAHAIVRYAGTAFKHPSRVVVWETGLGPIGVAVHSYLDVFVPDSEALELAEDYLREIGIVDRPADIVY